MRGGAYGRPNVRLIPRGWAGHAQRTANSTHTAACEIRGAGAKVYNDTTHQYEDTPGTLAYAGGCRVQRINRELVREAGEQAVTTTDYQLSLDDPTAFVEVDMRVTFTDAEDPLLLTKRLIVTNVLVGSLNWGRDLFASDDQG